MSTRSSARRRRRPKAKQEPQAAVPRELRPRLKRERNSHSGKDSVPARRPGLRGFFKDNGLSIAFIALFVACFFGQAISGYYLQFENPAGTSSIRGFVSYVASAEFVQGMSSNWQAALLQLLVLIVFSIFLKQRGASHSRKPDTLPKGGDKPPERKIDRNSSWLYRNSLSLAFTGLFAAAFALHFFSGAAYYNQERVRESEQPFSLLHFLVSAKFWFETLQTWQAEFMAISVFIILSVYLRQERSAESKKLDASQDDTGDVNE
jgi:hypothetical protein